MLIFYLAYQIYLGSRYHLRQDACQEFLPSLILTACEHDAGVNSYNQATLPAAPVSCT